MIIQIVVIVVVLVLLYLLLRHWPETEAAGRSQTGWAPRPAAIAGLKTERRSVFTVIAQSLTKAWSWLRNLFMDDKQRAATHLSKTKRSEEFSEFIGVKDQLAKVASPFKKAESRADRVGREKRLPGPLSPLRASKSPTTKSVFPPIKPATPIPPVSPAAPASGEPAAGGWRGLFGRTGKSATVEPVPTAAPTEAELFMARAETAKRNNNFTEAEKLLVKAAAKEPRNPRVYAKLGILYLEQGENWKEAEESFLQALKFDSNNGFIHNNLGLVLYNQDRFAAAAKEFEQACRLDDGLASRHANLGLCWLSLRQYSKAEQEFKRAARLEPKNPEYDELLKEAAEKRRTHRSN